MKRIILLTTLFGFLAFNLQAQTKQEKIKELFQLMKSEKLFDAIIENTSTVYKSSGTKLGPKKDSIYNAFLKDEMSALRKKLYDKDMVEIYDKYFTILEIQKYIDFYKSPEGQKLLDVMPAMMKDVMQNMMNKDMQDLKAKFKKKLEELKDN